jgi:hypothetical protein
MRQSKRVKMIICPWEELIRTRLTLVTKAMQLTTLHSSGWEVILEITEVVLPLIHPQIFSNKGGSLS